METQCCSCFIHGKSKWLSSMHIWVFHAIVPFWIVSDNTFVFFFHSKKISSKRQPDFMNPLWEKILTGKKKIFRKIYSNCWLLIKDDEFCFWFFLYHSVMKSILNVSAIVLANLCVSYIMTSQNEEAEELMRKIEKVFSIMSDFR